MNAIATRTLTILGATGSIGGATLDVVNQANRNAQASGQPPLFRIIALTAHSDWRALASLAIEHRAQFVALSDPRFGDQLKEALSGHKVAIGVGAQALVEAAQLDAEIVMASIVGAAGLAPTLAAAQRGAAIALANKECLVCAGSVFLETAKKAGSKLLPTDSEHNAIFQVLDNPDSVEKLILTASGGPFRTWTPEQIARATPAQAIAHPNWSMGQKISVDCASLMNKGLELIEAAFLFDMPEHKIDVLIHPQSVIHSLVAYHDGSVLAQLGAPDMRIPISNALAWPARLKTDVARLNLAQIGQLDFQEPDLIGFPALKLARDALKIGGAAPTILNAANEIAVQAFLDGNVSFPEIAAIVSETLEHAARTGIDGAINDLASVYEADAAGRKIGQEKVDLKRFTAA
jgi:1-deoxy-D-xylulose-5-phosphate reductoisomerase